jgi:hypothetical protein
VNNKLIFFSLMMFKGLVPLTVKYCSLIGCVAQRDSQGKSKRRPAFRAHAMVMVGLAPRAVACRLGFRKVPPFKGEDRGRRLPYFSPCLVPTAAASFLLSRLAIAVAPSLLRPRHA